MSRRPSYTEPQAREWLERNSPPNAEGVRAIADSVGLSHATVARAIRSAQGAPARPARGKSGVPHEPDFADGFVEIPVIHRHYEDLDVLRVYPLGDVHRGSDAHDEATWLSWLAYLEGREGASMLGTGDFLNAALKNSVSEVYDEIEGVGDAKRAIRAQLQPLADQHKIDLLMPGNHEARIHKAIGDCPILDICDSLDVPYAANVALVLYHVGEITYEAFVRHGTGAGDVGARATRLAKIARTIHADLYVSGHTHSQLVFPSDVFHYDERQDAVVRRHQKFVSSGSFVRFEPYAARSGFAPEKIGAPRIRLSGTEFDVKVSV